MLCPWCGEENNRVLRTYPADNENIVMRVRQCLTCGDTWVTEEKARPPKMRPGVAIVVGTR